MQEAPKNNHISVKASFPGPGKLNLEFHPPIQTWRFPRNGREDDGRRAVLDACRDAVRQETKEEGGDPSLRKIEAAVEAVLGSLVDGGTIRLP